jgi:hypothetical protein
MGAACFKATEPLVVVALEDAKKMLLPIIVNELKTIIIPDLIVQLNMTEQNLNTVTTE